MTELRLADRIVQSQNPAFVMGIVNATPDSFWKKSRGGFALAMRLIEEGADIIDVGGESTRPGSEYIGAEEEIRRVVPLVKKIRAVSDVPICVDTRKYDVMSAAFDAGADMLNDVSALEDDARLCGFAAARKIPVVLMHKRPCKQARNHAIMHGAENCADGGAAAANCADGIFSEVDAYLTRRAEFAIEAGIAPEKIIVDPGIGIGFGKDRRENAVLIKRAAELCGGRFKVLMALSRKSFIGEVCDRDVDARLWGTISANVYSVLNGVSIVRVHDVRAAVDSIKILREILNVGD